MKPRTALMTALVALWAGSIPAQAQNYLYNGDFEADPFPDGWTVSTNVLSFGGFAPGSAVAAKLEGAGQRAGQGMIGAADWALDFYFAIRNAGANRAFSLLINQAAGPDNTGAATINLRYQSGQFNTFAGGAWGADLGLGTIHPSVDANNDGDFNDPGDAKNIYHMRITGAGWGTPTANYSLQLSEANQTNLTRSVNGLTRYQNGSGVNGGPMAFVFNTAFGSNPGFWVDDVTHEVFYVADDPNLELASTGDLFGRLPVDSPPVTRVLTVTNSGAANDLYITNAVVSGADAARYKVETAFPIVLPPGGATNISVMFDAGTGSRQFSASLTLNSNDPTTPAFKVNLAAIRLATGTQLLANPGFELNPFDSGWISGTNVTRADGLVSGSSTAAWVGPDMRLGQQIVCSPDWYMDFHFALTDPVNEAFSFYVTTVGDMYNAGEIKLRVIYATNQWLVAGNPQPDLGTIALSTDANGDRDLADAGDVNNVYRMRLTGHAWNTTNATVDVQLSEANQSEFARGIYGVPLYTAQAVPYAFAFTTMATNNPGFWVDETAVVVGLPLAERPRITSFVPGGGSFRMTWTSEPNATYQIETTDTLGGTWQTAFGPVASEGTRTSYTNTTSATTRFFRIRKE